MMEFLNDEHDTDSYGCLTI